MSRATVVVFDYGSGNLHSALQALRQVGAEAKLSSDPQEAMAADGLVLPGVGAFAACMRQLEAHDGASLVRRRLAAGKALLGICVGHQILFAHGFEHEIAAPGIGVYPGQVRLVPTRRLPHMGWNEVQADPASRFFRQSERFYFVHSYAALSQADLPPSGRALWCEHEGVRFIAAVEDGPVLSTQFHPEKSGQAGLALLSAWTASLGAE